MRFDVVDGVTGLGRRRRAEPVVGHVDLRWSLRQPCGRARRRGRASNLCWVTFRPASIQGAVREAGGAIDYRLARHALVSEFKKGRLAEHEVCDAHPELVRAARELGDPTSMTCPICEETQVVLVSYVFGPRLPAHGRCVSQKGELAKLAKRKGDLTCYVVEVCPNCSWNHLARTFPL